MAQDVRGAGVGHRGGAPRHGSGAISIVGLRKEFEGVTAVDGINVEIGAGEFFTLLGPSGCGKTTTLRMLAGFEQPTDGQILLDGVDVAQTPAHKRPVNTVFQSYALFPHLDVRKNVEYGLRWRKDVDSKTRAARVARALELVRLTDYAKRRPHQMSGGQQQRVALARALVLEPSVLLLDEPLGALDAKLRHSLRAELTSLQRDVGITFVFVTHDQEEALEMSDRLAVMDGGRIAQLGTPQQVYQEPRSEFVANFLGVANLMDVECLPGSGTTRWVRFGDVTLEAQAPDGCEAGPGRAIIRPESVEVGERGRDGGNRVPGMVDRAVFLGSTTQVSVRLPHGAVVQSLVTNASVHGGLTSGQAVSVHLPPEALRVLSTSSSAPAAVTAEV
ncbi:MAG: Spermidine/putrescine import ABC transporter ATP-binding protein PotA [uncultured Nocardioidaceae bacterium]|uniref:Spermidine/putrescine import ATP-binding protein PotA n=1 Tax=uncultured Nocardioidaceae bacterium TaxID=253824 RepID=A0A6J4MQP7_9ACTN|nr:MAG: Spermidine/putrescine import ABC transporter ATP-binding protein PotA [uncultured Nocardioidaceae bacterium]